MNKAEFPPKDDVETFEDDRELYAEKNTAESRIEEVFEQASENHPGKELTSEEKNRIEKLKKELSVDSMIDKAMQSKDSGDEKLDEVSVPPAKHVSGLRKVALSLGLLFTGLTGAKASTHEGGKDPIDSTKKAKMEQTIRAIENNLEINDTVRADWNDYTEWLKVQGLQGSATLDHNGLGMQKLREYVESHPGTSLEATEKGVREVQAEFIKYRKWVLDEVKAGRAELTPGTTEENFMSWLSQYDGIPGQFTTKSQFPKAKEIKTHQTVFNNDTTRIEEKTTVTSKGFAKTGKDFTKRNDTTPLPGSTIAKN